MSATTGSRLWATGAIILAVVVVGAALLVVWIASADSRAPQPLAFNHTLHDDAGIPCSYCHSGATRSPVSGIPSVEKCMGCHDHIDTGSPELQKLRDYWDAGDPIPWVRMYQTPRYVHYKHHVHIEAGLNCETCHGNVGEMQALTRAQRISMGWCIRCHQAEPNAVELMECQLCHY